MKSPEELKNWMKQISLQEIFIEGIFNYCDRWCEKCDFTLKCLNFALSGEDPDSGETDNRAYLKNVFDATCLILDDLIKANGIDISKIEFIPVSAEKDPEAYPLSIYVKDSVLKIHNWLKNNDLFGRLNNLRELGAPLSDRFNRYKESVEVIYRYNYFISAKVTRAVAGLLENMDFSDKDMNGSAKVALVSIDRLIVAWSYIFNESKGIEDDVLKILINLTEIRKRIELTFPDARKFLRPGLDNQNVS